MFWRSNKFNLKKSFYTVDLNRIKSYIKLFYIIKFKIVKLLEPHFPLSPSYIPSTNYVYYLKIKKFLNFYLKLIVIGVHSSKFQNEKSKSNIINATKRHLIKHPVVLDFELELWNSLEIICWPTLLVVDPQGLVIAEFVGEIKANYVHEFLENAFKYYDDKLNKSDLDLISNYDENQHDDLHFSNDSDLSKLSFPTKIIIEPEENLLFISDSGNNRILCVDSQLGTIRYSLGNGKPGFSDGNFENAEFDWPQGLAYDKQENILYIADTFNDLIRVADLNTCQVARLCGLPKKSNKSIGHYDYVGGKNGLEQSISSPWDLCLTEKDNSKILLIASAGTHQIWLYSFRNQAFTAKLENDLNYLVWWKSSAKIEWKTLVCVAGNGKERNKNNSYPMQASFAQPSGLCIDKKNGNLYIADAESSSIRFLSLKDGNVKGLVGGDQFQPDNLFAYGDSDGKG